MKYSLLEFLKRVLMFFKMVYYDLVLARQCFYDFNVYRRFYSRSGVKSGDYRQKEARIIMYYHVLEKGLSHHSPKEKFGLEIAERTVELLEEYFAEMLPITQQIAVAIGVLDCYSKSNHIVPYINQELVSRIAKLKDDRLALVESEKLGSGFLCLEKNNFFNHRGKSFEEFAFSRHSCRNFTQKEVPLEKVKKAVQIAQQSPSVCNRQTCRVHCIAEKKTIRDHLYFQQGNRGFGGELNKLLIVTSDIRLFVNIKERNQMFIDGGIFSMSLLYALHSLSVGAVALNWSYDSVQDSNIRKLGVIPENEKIILMIGVGDVPESFLVAASQRRPISEVFVKH